MRIFDRAYQVLVHNREVRERGGFNCIPFPDEISRFRNFIPGLQRKNYVIITANSGVAKSKFAKYFYVISPHKFIQEHGERLDMKLDTQYFCLEESKESFVHSLICNRLWELYRIRVDIKVLKSIHYERWLTAEVLEKVNEMRDYFYQLEDNLVIVDDVRNATGIYKEAEKFIEKDGRWIMKPIDVVHEDGTVTQKEVKDYFVMNHPNHYKQIVVDHKSLFHKEKGDANLWEAISLFSSQYAIKLRDKLGAAVTTVQQQEASREKQQYTVKGVSIEEKLEPALDGLGDNKTTQRDADEIIGIFSPIRHKIMNHRGYNIALLRDNYRSAIILKCRDGSPDLRVGLYFDGAVNYFKELPKAIDMEDDLSYEPYLQLAGREMPRTGVLNFNE